MRPTDQQTVRALELFAHMREAHFRTLMNAAFLQAFPPRVELIREGEQADFLHVLVEGAVEQFAAHNGRETTIEVLVPTTTFILAAVIRDEVYLKSARTLADSRILMIPAAAVRDVFGRDSAFARAVVGELASRYRSIVRALKNQKLRTGAERLASWILQADAQSGSTGQVILPFEKRLLASLLGMTPENLSRSFATLGSHGVESEGPNIVVRDREKLRRLAQPTTLIDGEAGTDPRAGRTRSDR
jgi:CRP/FNR family transcriptional activator FtrB